MYLDSTPGQNRICTQYHTRSSRVPSARLTGANLPAAECTITCPHSCTVRASMRKPPYNIDKYITINFSCEWGGFLRHRRWECKVYVSDEVSGGHAHTRTSWPRLIKEVRSWIKCIVKYESFKSRVNIWSASLVYYSAGLSSKGNKSSKRWSYYQPMKQSDYNPVCSFVP